MRVIFGTKSEFVQESYSIHDFLLRAILIWAISQPRGN